MNDLARHRLWSKWDAVIGEESAGYLMELLWPAYESIMARRLDGEEAPVAGSGLSISKDRDRHFLWRKLEEKLGTEEAATMIELWDEAGRLKGQTTVLGAA